MAFASGLLANCLGRHEPNKYKTGFTLHRNPYFRGVSSLFGTCRYGRKRFSRMFYLESRLLAFC